MGAAVARCLAGRGHPVLWASQDRSPETAARARAAGLRDAGTLPELARQASVILSICPPHAALGVARAAAGAGFRGVFVDANAISPGTAREVAAVIGAGGASYVDGGIIGPPAGAPGTTRLYLAGRLAGEVRDLFTGTELAAPVLPGDFAASALKMAYAAWTKGTAALLLAARALARAEGVEDALTAEWALSQPGLAARSERSAGAAATKGWRWVAEMEEIAATMGGAGLPDGFHRAAAEIYRRSAPARPAPDGELLLEAVLSALLRS